MARIYLDSNVLISIIRQEVGRGMRGLFVEAENFLKRAGEKKEVIVLSRHFFKEVEKVTSVSQSEAQAMICAYGVKTETTKRDETKLFGAYKARGLHAGDALHAALAVTRGCDYLVTFNARDFKNLEEIEVLEPDEFR